MMLAVICLASLGLALLSVACCTPRRWWQRPTMFAASVLLAFAATYAFALWHVLHVLQNRGGAAPPAQVLAVQPKPQAPREIFRVQQALHLRSSSATRAPLLALLPANQLVLATGLRDGDWWQVCSSRGLGWVSSLWLRRLDEPKRDAAHRLDVPQCVS